MDLSEFIKNNTPKKKKSIFDDYAKDITQLIELNYSQAQVIEYLKSKCKNKTGLSSSNLSIYLKKRKKQNTKEVKNIISDLSQNKTIKEKFKFPEKL